MTQTTLGGVNNLVVGSQAVVVDAVEGKSMAIAPIKKQLKLGPVAIESGSKAPNRMAILLWGPATCGKTTLAATAPGHKLFLSFGDNEHTSVMHRKDVSFARLYALGLDELIQQARSDDPFGLDAVLSQREDIETVVCDSATALTFRALQKAVRDGIGSGTHFRPTMEAPGQSAYGARNAIVLVTLTGLLRITAKYNVHLIVTAHEDDAKTTPEGVVDYISIMLGGKLVNNMTWRFSEIWFMREKDSGNKMRELAVRPTLRRRPMKTRMFQSIGEPSFDLTYDATKPDKGQMTIAKFYEDYRAGGYEKLPIPRKGK